MVVVMSLDLEASVLLSSPSQTSVFSVLMFGGDDPVDSGISSDGLVEGVHKHYLEEFIGSVLADPVRVQYSQILCSSTDSVLSDGSVGPAWLKLGDTLVHRLTVDDSLGDGLLSSSSPYSDSVDDISLLSFVA